MRYVTALTRYQATANGVSPSVLLVLAVVAAFDYVDPRFTNGRTVVQEDTNVQHECYAVVGPSAVGLVARRRRSGTHNLLLPRPCVGHVYRVNSIYIIHTETWKAGIIQVAYYLH